MFLSIIIPAYNPDPGDLFCLLSSIRTQLAVDFSEIEVLIVNDAGRKIDESTFKLLSPLRVQVINRRENGGPGMARQTGIEAARGEFLMFCDCDDVLHNVGVLSAIALELQGEPCDLLVSKWLEELKSDDGRMVYINHDPDWTWMHGKVFRRSFILDNHLQHHPDLRIHEDSYFLNVLSACLPRMKYSELTSYVWRWHDGTITRRNNAEYSFSSVPEFLRAVGMADEVIEAAHPEMMPERVVYRTCYLYHMLHSAPWQERGKVGYLKSAESTFRTRVAPYWHYWAEAPEDLKLRIYRDTMHFLGDTIPEESLPSWIARVDPGEAARKARKPSRGRAMLDTLRRA